MTAFLLYIARSGLYVGVFYVFFLLIMRRTKEFRLNRLILFTGSYLCLLFPLIRFRTAAVPGLNSNISGLVGMAIQVNEKQDTITVVPMKKITELMDYAIQYEDSQINATKQ